MQRTQIGPWEIEYDREATRTAYARMKPYGCTCAYCRNYVANVSSLPDAVLQLLDNLGIDPAKPTEVFTYGMSNLLEYNGFYHLVGKCAAHALQWLSVAERFEVGFTQNIDMQPDEISPEQTLQMEISFQLPWLLDDPYTE